MVKLTGYKYRDADGEPCIGVLRSDGKFVAIWQCVVKDGDPWLTGERFNFDEWCVQRNDMPDDTEVIWERDE